MPIPIADLIRIDLSAFISELDTIQDDPSPDPPFTKYNDLFTTAGSGRQNMVDFFRDMSHGVLDLTGTRVFGWFTLPAKRADYVGNVYPQPAGNLNRNGLLDLVKSSGAVSSVPLGDFAGVVVSARGGMDLCGCIIQYISHPSPGRHRRNACASNLTIHPAVPTRRPAGE